MAVNAWVPAWVRVIDLRFPSQAEEEQFHLSQETYTIQFARIMSAFTVFALTVVLFTRREVLQTDNVDAELVAPRLLLLWALVGSGIGAIVIFCLTLVNCWRPILRARWELVSATSVSAMIVISLVFITPWYIPQYYGLTNEEVWLKESRNTVMMCLLSCMTFTSATCFFACIRSHCLVMVPASGVLTHTICLFCLEDPFPDGRFLCWFYLVLVSTFSFYGAWRHQKHVRKEWLASRKVIEQEAQVEEITLIKQAFAAMAGTTSDLVLVLDSDLNIIPDESVQAHEAYFGRLLGDLAFPELLAEEIRARFNQLIEEAAETDMLLSMPAEIELRWGVAGAQLVLVGIKSRSHARYLVGLHFNDPTPIQEAELRQSVPLADSPRHLPTVPEAVPSEVDQEDQEVTSYKETNKLESFVSTTYTGQIFEDIEKIPEGKNPPQPGGLSLKSTLKRIAKLGMAEHWLVPSSEVELLPDKVLGRGGFSQVMLGRLRGSPVAAKVPKRASTVNISVLNSLVNEIRVLRHLRHSNIALFYGACIDPASGHLALLYEVITGYTGSVYAKAFLVKMKGMWQWVCQAKLLLDIASALHYLHSLSPAVVHGDIKGDNVMVETQGKCPHGKLMDFGLSRLRTRYPRSLGGTRYWIAPEVVAPAESRPKPMPASDVYSFGWFIYFITTFTHPAAAIDRTKLAQGNSTGGTLLWPLHTRGRLRAMAEPLVLQCLRQDFLLRPRMADVIRSLLTWIPEEQEVLGELGLPVVMMLVDGWRRWEEGLEQSTAEGPPEHRTRAAESQKDQCDEAKPDEEVEEDEEDEDDDDGYSGRSLCTLHMMGPPTKGSLSKVIAPVPVQAVNSRITSL